jgi:hypothetical protein
VGKYPGTLEEAARKYLKEVPTDFWGKALGYSLLADGGVKLESVGPLASDREDAVEREELIVVEVHGRSAP